VIYSFNPGLSPGLVYNSLSGNLFIRTLSTNGIILTPLFFSEGEIYYSPGLCPGNNVAIIVDSLKGNNKLIILN
jgi:hypothetical protein